MHESTARAPGKRRALVRFHDLPIATAERALGVTALAVYGQWVVSGVITEFRGANYLLVTKAVIRLQEGETAPGP